MLTSIIGLTGNIAVGKSTVAKFLEEFGASVIKCDSFMYETYASQDCLKQIVDCLGEGILNDKGSIDRLLLKKALIVNPNQIHTIWDITNACIEPKIVDALKSHKQGLLFFEATQLYECRWNQYCAKTIVCVSDNFNRARYIKARALAESLILEDKDVQILFAQQMPQDEKSKNADYVIVNNGSLYDLRSQTNLIYDKICYDMYGVLKK